MQLHFDVADVLREGLELFRIAHDRLNDANKNRRFREKFGCSPTTVSILWDEIEVVEKGASLKHLFWTFYFFKVYPLESDMRDTFNAHPHTVRQWIRRFTAAIGALFPVRVSSSQLSISHSHYQFLTL